MDQQTQQSQQKRIEQSRQTVQQLSREARSIAQQLTESQVAAARAAFNFSNLFTWGAMTPLADRFEEGLDLYTRTVHEVQDTSSRITDSASQTLTEMAKEGDKWSRAATGNIQTQKQDQRQGA